jgi:hypothetical protein
MTPKELADFQERNRRAPVPPGFGMGKRWRRRHVEFCLRGGKRRVATIPNGAQVNPLLRAYYWTQRELYQDMLEATKEAGVKMHEFVIIEEGRIIGAGCIDPTDGANDIAWLACMFAEMNDWTIAFFFPENFNVDLSHIKNIQVMVPSRPLNREAN